MTKRTASPKASGPNTSKRRGRRNVALNSSAGEVKRALPRQRSSTRNGTRRAVAKKDAGQAFNPLQVMIDNQIQLVGAMMRCSPFGFFLRSVESEERKAAERSRRR